MIAALLILAQVPSSEPPPPPIVRVAPRVIITPTAPRESDAEACAELTKLTAAMMAELPKMIDGITRVDGVSVFCSLRTFASNKFVTMREADMRSGWRDRKQAQWNEINCRGDFLPLIKRGWRITQNLTFASGERYTFDAECE